MTKIQLFTISFVANDDDDGGQNAIADTNSSVLTKNNHINNNSNHYMTTSSPKLSSDPTLFPNECYSFPQRFSGERSLPRTPSIVVTPTPDDANQRPFVLSVSDSHSNPFKSLSEKLANYSNQEIQNNTTSYEKIYMGDDNKYESEEEDEEESTDGSSSSGEDVEEHTNGLKSIRSVTDIKVYKQIVHPVYLVEELETEDSVSEDEEGDDEEEIEIVVDEHDPHELSVILEESDKTKSNHRSRSLSSTDCSTTLANDDTEEEVVDGDLDDEENSVTVRLPLKLSFSRSLDNEEITTVVVGNSETKEKSGSDSLDRPVITLQPTISDTDVSVSFSVPSRSSSITRTNFPASNDVSDAEDEVSVSVSLPMMRNKFARQSMSLDTENNDIESLDSDTKCEDDDSDEVVEIEIAVPDAEIDDIWGDGSPELRRRPIIYQPVQEETEEDTLTEESETSDSSSEEEVEQQKVHIKIEAPRPKIVKPPPPEPKYKVSQLIKCEVRFETNILQMHPYHSMIQHLNMSRPQTAELSYQEPEIRMPTYDRGQRCRAVTPIRSATPTPLQQSTSRPSQSEMESIHNRLRCITPIRSLTPTRSTTPVLEHDSGKPTTKESEEKLNVRQRIQVFERIKSQEFNPDSPPSQRPMSPLALHSYSNQTTPRNSYIVPEEESADEDDSGVPSDHSRQISDSECENFPELRKMTAYQRAATHSRLFKLLQEDDDEDDDNNEPEPQPVTNKKVYNPKKIVHNVSITRRNNPNAMRDVESLEQRRQRLSLPLAYNRSSDQDSTPSSSSASSVSPTNHVSDKLISEFVESFMKKQKHKLLRNVSMERIHTAARKALQDDLEFDSVMGSSQEVSTVSSTPAITPQEFKNGYSDYYESFNRANDSGASDADISSASRSGSDLPGLSQKRLWAVKCPRVLSSKTVNRDLSLIRESESPEPTSFRRSVTPSRQSPAPTTRYSPFFRHSYHN